MHSLEAGQYIKCVCRVLGRFFGGVRTLKSRIKRRRAAVDITVELRLPALCDLRAFVARFFSLDASQIAPDGRKTTAQKEDVTGLRRLKAARSRCGVMANEIAIWAASSTLRRESWKSPL